MRERQQKLENSYLSRKLSSAAETNSINSNLLHSAHHKELRNSFGLQTLKSSSSKLKLGSFKFKKSNETHQEPLLSSDD